MSELEDRLNAVLSNPGELSRLAKMAQQLMGGDAPSQPAPEPARASSGTPDIIAGLAGLMRNLSGGGKKSSLLDAVGPYLDDERRARLGRALRLASAAKTALPALREIGGVRGL